MKFLPATESSIKFHTLHIRNYRATFTDRLTHCPVKSQCSGHQWDTSKHSQSSVLLEAVSNKMHGDLISFRGVPSAHKLWQ